MQKILYNLDTGQFPELICNVALLPRSALHAEVANGSGGCVNRTAQIQLANDATGSQIAGSTQQLGHLLIRDHTGAVAVHADGNGFSNADGVGQLNLNLRCQTGTLVGSLPEKAPPP